MSVMGGSEEWGAQAALSASTVGHSDLIGIRVDETSYAHASRQILDWALARQSRYVCVANVHMAMEAYDSPEFATVVNSADLVTPDGMPLVWALRALGAANQQRVYGPDLTLRICALAERHDVAVGFLGATPLVIQALERNLRRRFPKLKVPFVQSPPFRPMTPVEERDLETQILASGISILFVGLGCPKQERWMMAHRGRLQVVMVGVGAAFDFHAGLLRQAPQILQRLGLEWLFRLAMEPRRLWRRYLKHNPRFVALAFRQILGRRKVSQDGLARRPDNPPK